MNQIDYNRIRLLVLDVDGVMTDGRIILSASGEETKSFCVKDGSGMKFWKRLGGKLAIITGRQSEIVTRRAAELDVDEVRQNRKMKLPALEEVFAAAGVGPEATAVVGDDLPDLPMMRVCAFSACPSDAVEEVRRQADFVCQAAGGRGVVREVVEHLLKRAGTWPRVMERYLPDGEGNQG
ncbi:MAG: HAD hydrolase family protein [Phycisphaerae bacterium]|nr:HAD hydrolase family protein [Phycisphaerae bacterium]